ncbi:MAG TPA: hypothetical protein VHT27_06080 [Solirubrobacteraceae bacterium]|jgi:hypothetical protein|nr:hypothetical protein [Solirubrobacteraceae bacterium]
MAATELSRAATRARPSLRLARAIGLCYLGLWALTVLGAASAAVIAPAGARSALALDLRGAPPASLDRVLSLAAHNLPLAAWPLGLGILGADSRAPTRRLADWVVLASAAANTGPVAVALGGYGWALVPYVPQLPLEWGSLAVGYGSWLAHRRCAPSARRRLALLGAVASLTLAAAVIETIAPPHRTAASAPAH